MALDYAAINEGDALPPLEHPTAERDVLMFAGATWNWGEQFTSAERAAAMGFKGAIVPGAMKQAIILQHLDRWLDEAGQVRRLQLSYRRPDIVGEVLHIGGAITRKYEDGGEKALDLEIWVDNPAGERTIRGAATVVFP